MSDRVTTKVCLNSMCSEIAHYVEKSEKRCRNCDFRIVEIDNRTFVQKFAWFFFQYDYRTGDLLQLNELPTY